MFGEITKSINNKIMDLDYEKVFSERWAKALNGTPPSELYSSEGIEALKNYCISGVSNEMSDHMVPNDTPQVEIDRVCQKIR